MEAMCARALELGLTHYTITDHCECDQYDGAPEFGNQKYRESVPRSYAQQLENQARFPQLCFLRGIELGQAVQNCIAAEDALSGRSYDVVIGSLHNLAGMKDFYFLGQQASLSENDLDRLYHQYFQEIYATLEWGKFDTLAHITYPLRYFYQPGEKTSFAKYQNEVDAIFKKIIADGKALEFNSSRLLRPDAPILPDWEIFTRYKELGGTRITLGADAHRPQDIAKGIPEALDMLRAIGFTEYTVFIGRKPHQIPIEYIPDGERK